MEMVSRWDRPCINRTEVYIGVLANAHEYSLDKSNEIASTPGAGSRSNCLSTTSSRFSSRNQVMGSTASKICKTFGVDFAQVAASIGQFEFLNPSQSFDSTQLGFWPSIGRTQIAY